MAAAENNTPRAAGGPAVAPAGAAPLPIVTRRKSITSMGQTARSELTLPTDGGKIYATFKLVHDYGIALLKSSNSMHCTIELRKNTDPLSPIFATGPLAAAALRSIMSLSGVPLNPAQNARLAAIETGPFVLPDITESVINATYPDPAIHTRGSALIAKYIADHGLPDDSRVYDTTSGILEGIQVTADPDIFAFKDHGYMRRVAVNCTFGGLTLLESGVPTFAKYNHSVSYLTYNKSWYRSDNVSGFLEKRENNSAPQWDTPYSRDQPWLLLAKSTYFVSISLLGDILRLPAAGVNETGLVTPLKDFISNRTCTTDSIQTILMFSDGLRNIFDGIYQAAMLVLDEEDLEYLEDPDRTEGICPIVFSALEVKKTINVNMRGPRFNRRVLAKNSITKLLLNIFYIISGNRISAEDYNALNKDIKDVLLLCATMCIRKKSWETHGRVTHVGTHPVRGTLGGYLKSRKLRNKKRLRRKTYYKSRRVVR